MGSIAVTVCRGRTRGAGGGGHWRAVKQEMSKIQIFFKLNLKTLARCLHLAFFLFPFLSLFCLLAKNGFYTWLQIAQRQQQRPKPMPMPTLTRFMRSSLVQERRGRGGRGQHWRVTHQKPYEKWPKLAAPNWKQEKIWLKCCFFKRPNGPNWMMMMLVMMAMMAASAASVWQWWMPDQARPRPGQSSRAHIPRPQRVQRANEIGKYALATRKENMSSRTDGEMKNSQAEAEARTIWETIALQRIASIRGTLLYRFKIIFMRLWFMRHKAGIGILFPFPCPAPACSPGQGQLLGWAAPTIYCRFDARQMNIGQTGWQQQHRRQGQRQRPAEPAEAAQLFDFGLSVSPIFVFVFRICICARARACACVCVWRCRCQKLKVSFSIWHSIERWAADIDTDAFTDMFLVQIHAEILFYLQ